MTQADVQEWLLREQIRLGLGIGWIVFCFVYLLGSVIRAMRIIMSDRQSNYLHCPVKRIHQETDKAFLVEFDKDEGSTHWVPKSQVADAEDYEKGDRDCTLSVNEWFIKKEGLTDVCEE